MASSAMKLGCCPNLAFSISFSTLILHGIGVSGSLILSKCLILSCFIVLGFSPDCLTIVKKAFSLILEFCVILLISSFVMFLFSIFVTLSGGSCLWIRCNMVICYFVKSLIEATDDGGNKSRKDFSFYQGSF